MTNIIAAFLELIILSSIAITAVLLIRLLFNKKLHTTILSLLWILVLARLLIPYTFNSPVNIDSLFQNNIPENTALSSEHIHQYDIPADTNVLNTSEYDLDSVNADYENTPVVNSETIDSNTIAHQPKMSLFDSALAFSRTNDFWLTILTIWAIGAWLNFFINGYAIYNFSKKISKCEISDNDCVKNSLNKAKQTIGANKEVQVMECKFINSPITYGVINPKILLPKGFVTSITPKKLYMIFLHELSHIKNNDILKNYLWLVARMIYWFNPLVYIAYNRYQDDIEYICDEAVIQCLNGKSTIEYTESLLDTVRISSQTPKIPVALPFCKSKSSLRKRVENMLNPQKKSKTFGIFTMLLCAVIIISCFTTACISKEDINVIDSLDAENIAFESENNTVSLSNENTDANESLNNNGTISTKDITNEPQPIKSNPVGSEKAALEIARNLNISKTEDFSYSYYYQSDEIMPIHDIIVNSDTEFTTFRIYDCNGEIRMLQTSVFMSKEIGEELPAKQLIQNVNDLAMEIYPNTRLDIIDCVKDESTWTIEGITHKSKDYIVTGLLYDYEDNSTRTFESKVLWDGAVRYISAEYSNMDYLMLSDDVRNKLLSYADSEDADIEIYHIEEYYGDYLLHFSLGNGKGYVTLLQSDMSLVDLCIAENEKDIPFQLIDDDILNLVQQYADLYFPDNQYITIKENDISLNNYVGEGTITFANSTLYFYIVLDGDGRMHKIGIESDYNPNNIITDKISLDAATDTAINELKMQCDFVGDSGIIIIRAGESFVGDLETFKIIIQYISPSPTVYDYSLTAEFEINAYTGEYLRMHIDPVLDELDILSEDEAIALGRQYLENIYGINGNDFVLDSASLDAFFVLQYQINFRYNNESYIALIMPDTGEDVGTGKGG